MKLKTLWIDGFKNLSNVNIDFSNKAGITVLIGNNGSGKSNVLEAISAIFYDLYNINSNTKPLTFNYKIEYEIGVHHILLKYTKETATHEFMKFNSYGIEEEIDKFKLEQYLPSNVLMIYSGDDTRILKQYYEPFTRKFQKSVREAQSIPSLPKMLYLDKFFWTISLLVLLKSELPNNKEFCKKILKNNTLENIEFLFTFNKELLQQQVTFLNQLANNEEEKTFTYDEFCSNEFIPNEKDLFIHLTSMVGQKNKIKKLQIKNNEIDSIHLSEGEKKQILIRVALEILSDENTLMLMDEPDANVHVANKIQIKDMLTEYPNRENILTTHSPSLTHAFDEKHITIIVDGQIEDRNKQEIFSHISDGIWNYQEQSVFLSSNKKIILLVEGKHDKIHIEEAYKRLKNNYSEIDFDIFNMHGVYNITNFMNGMKKSSDIFDNTKIYIGIFDYDQAGKEAIYNNPVKKKYASLKGNQNFYHMYLPFIRENEDFEIENMYPQNIIKDAYKKAIDGLSSNINKLTIEDKAKTILSDNCHSFQDEDFVYFEKLFDLIKAIYIKQRQ